MPKKKTLSIEKAKSFILHQYAHYSFEMEIHPDDDPEGLNRNFTPQPPQPTD